jgi:hypothetical protein
MHDGTLSGLTRDFEENVAELLTIFGYLRFSAGHAIGWMGADSDLGR